MTKTSTCRMSCKLSTGEKAFQTVAVQSLSCVQLFETHGLQHTRLPCPLPSPRACSNSCPLSWDAIQPSHPLLPSSPPALSLSQHQCLFQGSWLLSGGQSIGDSASASVLPMNSDGLFPLGLTGLISLLSMGLSRVLSSTTVQKHQFFGTQPFLWSNSHICT